MEKSRTIIGSLIFILMMTGAIFVLWPEAGLQLQVEHDKSTFMVNESGEWVVAGRETSTLWNGTRKLTPISVNISQHEFENLVFISRISTYHSGIVVEDEYHFNPYNKDIEQFPVAHNVFVRNATGLIFQYEVSELSYNGTTREAHSPESFGRNMKVEWSDGAYYEKVTKLKDSGKLTVKYRVATDDEAYSVRLFDPPYGNVTPTSIGWQTNLSAPGFPAGTNSGGVTFSRADGKYGSGARFNAEANSDIQTVNIGNTGNITFGGWVKKEGNDTSDSTVIFWKTNAIGLRIEKSNNQISCYRYNSSGTPIRTASTASIPDDVYVHILCADDGSNMTIFYEGAYNNSALRNGGTGGYATNTNVMRIGEQDDTRAWNGTLDELMIWENLTFTEEMARLQYNSEVPLFVDNLVFYYDMNNGSPWTQKYYDNLSTRIIAANTSTACYLTNYSSNSTLFAPLSMPVLNLPLTAAESYTGGATDRSANQLAATLNNKSISNGQIDGYGTTVTIVPGRYGNGFDFQGTLANGWVQFNNAFNISASDATVCVWVKPNGPINYNSNINSFHVIGRYPGSAPEWDITYNNISNHYRWQTRNTSQSVTSATAVNVITYDGSWDYVCGIINRTSGQQHLYLDAVLVDTDNIATGEIGDSTYNVRIGHPTTSGSTTGRACNCSIDEVRIWDTVLTQAEIQAEMNSPHPVRGRNLARSFSFELENTTHTAETNYLVNGSHASSGAYFFDGDTDSLTYNDIDNGDTKPVTIVGWFKLDGDSYDSFAAGPVVNGERVRLMIRYSTNGMYIRGDWSGGSFMTGPSLGTGNRDWHHFAIQRDPTNGTYGTAHLYYQGAYYTSQSWGNTAVTYDQAIGRFSSGTFNGSIANVRAYDRLLSADEINLTYICPSCDLAGAIDLTPASANQGVHTVNFTALDNCSNTISMTHTFNITNVSMVVEQVLSEIYFPVGSDANFSGSDITSIRYNSSNNSAYNQSSTWSCFNITNNDGADFIVRAKVNESNSSFTYIIANQSTISGSSWFPLTTSFRDTITVADGEETPLYCFGTYTNAGYNDSFNVSLDWEAGASS